MAKAKTYNDFIGREPDESTVARIVELHTPTVMAKAIDDISAQLRGPLPDVERAMLVLERKEWRAALAKARPIEVDAAERTGDE